MTVKRTNGSNVIFYVYGLVHQVKLDGTGQTYGSTWQYILGNTVTRIVVGSHTDTFISFGSGSIVGQNLNSTGYVLGNTGVFPRPTLTITSPANVNVTEIGLFDASSLLQDHVFSVPIPVVANTPTQIPWNFTDYTPRSGLNTFTEEAVIQSGSSFVIVTSNVMTLNYGSGGFQIGNLNLNVTNTNVVPIWFERNDSGHNTSLFVFYPAISNMTCSLYYSLSQNNQTYYNLPFIVESSTVHKTKFNFINETNDIVTANCVNLQNTNQTARDVLTWTSFPFIEQIQQFRSGQFGTHGQFGALDIITLMVVIFSMIGFNRINEAVGAFFSIAIIGATAFFGILSLSGTIIAGVAVVIMVAIITTRKTGGF